jgi:spore coat protein CotF
MIPGASQESFQDFTRLCEYMLSENITSENLTDQELATVRMYIDMLCHKFLLS